MYFFCLAPIIQNFLSTANIRFYSRGNALDQETKCKSLLKNFCLKNPF